MAPEPDAATDPGAVGRSGTSPLQPATAGRQGNGEAAGGVDVLTRDIIIRFRRGRDRVELRFPDLDVRAGRHVVLSGPSGSGKTTLLHVLAGLLVPQSGKVTVGGEAVSGMDERQRDRYRAQVVGYLFQDFHLMPDYTALENVMLGLGLAGAPRAERPRRAMAMLEAVDMARHARRAVRRLSTGERQRVALARAVAHRPRLLLADEPTAHLDRVRAEQALALLRDTATELGVSLVVATHDPMVMQAIGTRIELTS